MSCIFVHILCIIVPIFYIILSAHHIITNIGMVIIPEAESKYLRKWIAATAIKYKLKLSAVGSQFRAKIQQSNGSKFNKIQRKSS